VSSPPVIQTIAQSENILRNKLKIGLFKLCISASP